MVPKWNNGILITQDKMQKKVCFCVFPAEWLFIEVLHGDNNL